MNEFSRLELLLGEESLNTLKSARCAVFGIGGVGSFAAEALARAGVGHITLVDSDTVDITNINRQIIALHSTLGMKKTDVAKARILDINPKCEVETKDCFYTGDEVCLSGFDWIADAIDSVRSKLALIENAHKENVRIISSMGTGNKFDPSGLVVTDISKTSVCPLAKAIRIGLRKKGILHHLVVYSTETPAVRPAGQNESQLNTVGSVSFVPPVAGMLMAAEIIKDIAGIT